MNGAAIILIKIIVKDDYYNIALCDHVFASIRNKIEEKMNNKLVINRD